MRFICCTTLFLAFTGLAFAEDKIDSAKLVGKWEEKNPGKGETHTVEFTKDGNVKIVRILKGGKETALEGTYKVDGDKLTMKVHAGNKKKSMDRVVTIDKLTDDEFVQTDDTKATKTFAKKSAATTSDASKTDAPKTDAPMPQAFPTDPLPKGTLPAADFKLTAGEYAKEFKDNDKEAKEKYKGKIVELSGTIVLTLGPALGVPKSSLTIKTKDPKDPFGPDVMCLSNDPEFFSRAGLDQTVRIKGKVGQFGSMLESSELVERGPDTRIAVAAESLAKDFTTDEEKASKKYTDKTLVVSGIIAAIKPVVGLKIKYVELKGDGKTTIECLYNDPQLVEKYKVGDAVKVYGAGPTISEKGMFRLTNCFPLSSK
jgi:uncharacterized protein (TIGR03066 family)